MKTVYLLRGVSGCGKTTLAKELESQLEDCVAISADDFWYDREGNYNFNINDLRKSHEYCRQEFTENVVKGKTSIILHNTSTSENEIEFYMDLAREYCYKVVSLVVENRHGNESVHDVPKKTLDKQERRLKSGLKLR